MKTQAINFYENFTCLMSDCPDTCCRGWQIYVDDDCLEQHNKQKGFDKLKSLILIGRFGRARINCAFGHCPYEKKDGLCQLHANGHTELMPLVCRTFPRRSIKLGSQMEVTLELSCPEAARLFLEQEETYFVDYDCHIPLESSAADDALDKQGASASDSDLPVIEPVWYMDDHEPAFLEQLKVIRNNLINYTKDATDLRQACRDMYVYMTFINNALLFQRGEYMSYDVEQCLGLLGDIIKSTEAAAAAEITGATAASETADVVAAGNDDTFFSRPAAVLQDKEVGQAGLFFSMAMYDKMLMDDICHESSRSRKNLKSFLEPYSAIFDDMEVELADDFLDKKFKSMIKSHPELTAKYQKYLIYMFQQTITACYEDYQILRAYLLSMVSLQTLMIMDVCDFVSGSQHLTEVEKLVAIDKSHRHNLSTQKNLMDRIRCELLDRE